MAGREGRRKLPTRRSSSFPTVAVIMLLPVVTLLIFFVINFFSERRMAVPPMKRVPGLVAEALGKSQPLAPAPAAPPPVATADAAPTAPARHQAATPKPVEKNGHGEIVLILDDVGFENQPLAGAMRIDPNLNFAVLPNGQKANEYANELHDHGFEVLCHLPMEPRDYPRHEPGPGAVLTSMSDEQIAAATRANVGAIPYARGVNNHMGSRATSDRRVMTDVLGALPKGMYFIDSMTAGSSIAGKLARQMSIKTASRNIFLDDVPSERAIRRQVAQLEVIARDRGVVVAIGHMYPATVKVLEEEAPAIRARGYRFVRASDVVD